MNYSFLKILDDTYFDIDIKASIYRARSQQRSSVIKLSDNKKAN